MHRLPRLRILDKLLLREFWLAFLATLAFCTLLLVVATIFDKFQEIIENEAPFDKVVLYFLCSLPFKLVQVMPLVAALGVLFSVGGLARNNEILAFLTSGVHSLRIAAPIIASGVIVLLCVFIVNEFFVAPLEQQARYLERRYIEAKSESKLATRRDIFVRGMGNRFYLMKMYDTRQGRMYSPQIVDMTEDYSTLRQRIDANEALFLGEKPNEQRSEWELEQPRIWVFDEDGRLKSFEHFSGRHVVFLEPDLSVILGQKKKPEEMNFFELRQHIEILAEREQPVFEYQTDLHRKLASPISILLAMLLAFSFAVRSRAGNATSAFGYGLAWTIAIYGVSAFFAALGHSGALSPLCAAWFPIFYFAAMTVYYVRKSYRWYA
ncbi:MAG: LptF/LptG family permease [Candidatus Sumerlaeaceae bacterium]|nr:LptF/LptG family permease [Candidatus Sumerlaeaceae bacterium]